MVGTGQPQNADGRLVYVDSKPDDVVIPDTTGLTSDIVAVLVTLGVVSVIVIIVIIIIILRLISYVRDKKKPSYETTLVEL